MATTRRTPGKSSSSKAPPSEKKKAGPRPKNGTSEPAPALPPNATGALIPIELIDSSPLQARRTFDEDRLEELAASIREVGGLLNPVTVREGANGRFELLAGERRLRAVKMLGLGQIPAVVLKADDRLARVAGLIENLQRQDLNPLDRANGLRALKEVLGSKTSWATVGRRVGLSKSRVSQLIALADLPEQVKQLVATSQLNENQAREVRRAAKDKAEMERVAEIVAETRLSAADVAAVTEELRSPPGVQKFNAPETIMPKLAGETDQQPDQPAKSKVADLIRVQLFKSRKITEKLIHEETGAEENESICAALMEHSKWCETTVKKLKSAGTADDHGSNEAGSGR